MVTQTQEIQFGVSDTMGEWGMVLHCPNCSKMYPVDQDKQELPTRCKRCGCPFTGSVTGLEHWMEAQKVEPLRPVQRRTITRSQFNSAFMDPVEARAGGPRAGPIVNDEE